MTGAKRTHAYTFFRQNFAPRPGSRLKDMGHCPLPMQDDLQARAVERLAHIRKLRRRNRKLKQRRPLVARLPTLRDVGAAVGRGLARLIAPAIVLVGLAALAGGGFLAYRWVRTSPRFAVGQVEVTGNRRVTSAEILRRAGISAGTNVFSIGLPEVERAFFARHPAEGAALVRQALAVAALWAARGDRPPLGEIHVAGTGLTLYTRDGAVAVRLGRIGVTPGPGELDGRFDRFDVVWSALAPEERAAARTIHLDSPARPDRVTVRLADARAGER